MTRKFTVNCDFGGQVAPFDIYVGKPKVGHHPLHFQSDWLGKSRGGMVPVEVMEAITQLQELAEKNGVALEDLCVYALGTQEQQDALDKENNLTDDEDNETEDSSAEEMAYEGGHIEEEEGEIEDANEKK